MDFFNPLGNKQAGKKKSVGMISLVCLNLPIELRYLPENMFLLGVIPGPKEPPLACCNHYLTPVQYSRTHECYYGTMAEVSEPLSYVLFVTC